MRFRDFLHLERLGRLLLLAGLLVSSSAAAELGPGELEGVSEGRILVRDVSAAGSRVKTFEAYMEIPAPRSEVLRVLQDYERYPEFMPRVRRTDVVERSGERAIVSYTLALPLGNEKRWRIEIAPERSATRSVLSWHLVAWEGLSERETIRDTRGSWQLEPGSGGEGSTLVTYRVYTDPGPVPLGFGWIVDWMSERSLPQVLERTRERVLEVAGQTSSS